MAMRLCLRASVCVGEVADGGGRRRRRTAKAASLERAEPGVRRQSSPWNGDGAIKDEVKGLRRRARASAHLRCSRRRRPSTPPPRNRRRRRRVRNTLSSPGNRVRLCMRRTQAHRNHVSRRPTKINRIIHRLLVSTLIYWPGDVIRGCIVPPLKRASLLELKRRSDVFTRLYTPPT
jgi:hypothetical protein